MPAPDLADRRPLKSRDLRFFQIFAAWLARVGVSPNAISFSSILFGAAAGVAFAATDDASGWNARLLWLGAAVCIQLRLIANLLDGMVAVEGGRGGPTGGLWNEAPDRVADAAILIGAGYAAGSAPVLGWAAALLAVFVAYVRALGASVGAGQCFLGPQAKPHRMFVMTVLALFGSAFPDLDMLIAPTHATIVGGFTKYVDQPGLPFGMIPGALLLVIIGCVVTVGRRLAFIARFLRTKSTP